MEEFDCNVISTRDSYPKWNGVQKAPSWNCCLWDGLDGWSTEPCVQRLHTGKKKVHAWVYTHCESLREEMSENEQIHSRYLENKLKRKDWNSQILGNGQTNDMNIVLRNISVCDYCLVECFLTSDVTLCPPWHQRLVRQETGLAHKRSTDRTSLMTLPLTPGTHSLLKIARPQCKSKLFIFTLNICLCLQARSMNETYIFEASSQTKTFTSPASKLWSWINVCPYLLLDQRVISVSVPTYCSSILLFCIQFNTTDFSHSYSLFFFFSFNSTHC